MLSDSEFTNPKCTRPGCGADAVIEEDESGYGIVVQCSVCSNKHWLHEFPEVEEEPREIELETELIGYSQGKKLNQPYKCRLIRQEGDDFISFQPGQVFPNGTVGWLGAWALKPLLSSLPDGLFIDAGQAWAVYGVRAALDEALKRVELTLKEG